MLAGHELTTSLLLSLSTSQHFLVPAAEPQSAGFPPVSTYHVVTASAGRRVRSLRSVSGQLIRAPISNSRRAIYSVGWSHIDRSEDRLLREFFGSAGVAGTQFCFEVEVDGPGSDVLRLRPLDLVAFELVNVGVYRIPDFNCEEVFV